MASELSPRIVMVTQSYLPRLGGAETQLSAVCAALRLRNYDPVIVTRRYEGMSCFEIINGTPVHRVPAPPTKTLAALSYLIFGFLKIVELKPNLIHAYELLSPSDLSIFAKKWLKIPLVVKVLRGGWMGDVYKLRNRWLGKIRLRRLKKSADMFTVINSEIKMELMAEGILEKSCRYIPNGVDVNAYKPVNDETKQKLRDTLKLPHGFLVLYSGRLAIEKGLDCLIPFWKHFNFRKIANLVIAGDGEEREKLQALADESVVFTGHLSELKNYYQTADAFILPSITEGLSNSLLEAMACGLPVIATSVGGAPEVIIHGNSGLLVSPGDTEELEHAINHLYNSPEVRKTFGDNARKVIQERFSLEATVKALCSLYSELLPIKGEQ